MKKKTRFICVLLLILNTISLMVFIHFGSGLALKVNMYNISHKAIVNRDSYRIEENLKGSPAKKCCICIINI